MTSEELESGPVNCKPVSPTPLPGRAYITKGYIKYLFAFFLFLATYVHQDPTNVTSASRLDLLHSLLKQKTWSIDAYHWNTPDKAFYGGAFYSDKPPGVAFLALPGFAAGYACLRIANSDLDSPTGWLVSSWLACASSLALISSLGACALFCWLRGWVSSRTAFLTTCGVFLGTAAFPYTTMMFSHSLVIGLICVCLWLNRVGWRNAHDVRDPWIYLVTGLSLGFSVASEFTATLVIMCLGAAICQMRRTPSFMIVAGALTPLLLIPFYNLVCFDNPLRLGYGQQASFPQMKSGLYGIGLPSLDVLLKLAFHPGKGLFVWSPFLALSVLGFPRLFKRSRTTFWICLLIPLLQSIVISGYRWDWPAGHTLTPRYLAPIIPFLVLPAALAMETFFRIGTILVTLSIVFILSATVIDASPAFDEHANFFTMYIPLIARGAHAPNLGGLLGLKDYWSLLPFFTVLSAGVWILYSWAAHDEISGTNIQTSNADSF